MHKNEYAFAGKMRKKIKKNFLKKVNVSKINFLKINK